MTHGKSRVGADSALPSLMLFWALIAPAPLLHYIGIKGLHSTVLTLVTATIIGIATHRRIRVSTLVASALLMAISLGNVVHWEDIRYLFYCLFFLCAVALVELSGPLGIQRFCVLATRLMMILLIGAVASFLIARVGISPLFTIANPDGQDYYFFYTGFTNSLNDNFIRASAIYDEPGAFSMYICFIAAIRNLLGQKRRTTWIMLGLGFITFSLAHLIYVMCHFLAEQSSKTRIIVLLAALASSLFILVTSIASDTDIVLLSRLALSEDTNFFAGDNRSFQLFNAWSNIFDQPAAVFFGLDRTCVFSQMVCQDRFGAMGENLLSPLAFGGLLSEFPYYAAIILFLISPLMGRRYIVVFGVGLLFLQRPYVMGFSYSLIAVMLLALTFQRKVRFARRRSTDTAARLAHGTLREV